MSQGLCTVAGMDPTLIVIVLLAIAVVALVVRLSFRPGAEQAENQSQHDLQELRASVNRLEDHVRDQLTPQVQTVEKVASELHKTLYSPNRRGQWAEQSLANILENSGLRKDHDYKLQLTMDDGQNEAARIRGERGG